MVRLTNVLTLFKTGAKRFAFWRPKPGEDWRRSLALTYALSVWSMIGIVAFMEWRKKDTAISSKTDNDDDDTLNKEPFLGRKQKVTFSASIEYKENHIPYTTRIYEYFTSSSKTSDNSSTEN